MKSNKIKMNHFLLALTTIFLFSCGSSNKEDTLNTDLVNSPLTSNIHAENVATPVIYMPETSYNFGEIQQGESVTHIFTLKNTGDADLIISAARGSCGCTVPEWPKNPIAKGEIGEIKITFNSAEKSGKQNKTVTLVSNSIPNTKVITINGNVTVPTKK